MVPDTSRAPPADAHADEPSSTVVNGLIGGIAGVVLSFVPLSTLLGGAVAGYLEGGEPSDWVRVGAVSGLVMLVPLVFVGLFFATVFLGFGAGGSPLAFGAMAVFVLLFATAYTVGLAVVGGYVGGYLERET